MQSSPTLLVFGVSGVGKTSACEDYVRRHTGWLYLRASALLARETGAAPETLRREDAGRIQANQELLGNALQRARAGRSECAILLDAHAIIDNDRELVPVPVEAVRALKPSALILLELNASELGGRRRAGTRKRPDRTTVELTVEMAREREVVEHYAAVLDVPLSTAVTQPGFILDPLIDRLLPSPF